MVVVSLEEEEEGIEEESAVMSSSPGVSSMEMTENISESDSLMTLKMGNEAKTLSSSRRESLPSRESSPSRGGDVV